MSSIEITKDTYLMWYESMLLMRKFEEKTGQLYGQQKYAGFVTCILGRKRY
jgi:pyruvate dehydrogenase E1 component alpha subunit